MKTYEKPRLTAISLSGNGALCQACAIDVVGDNADQNVLDLLLMFDSEISNLFESTDSCATECGVEGYCKFGPTADMTVFNS